MEPLPFTLIKTEAQYWDYCRQLEALVFAAPDGNDYTNHIELLTLLIENYDSQHRTLTDQDPISLLKYLLAEHRMKAQDLSAALGVSKALISDILNYKRGLSKEMIRKLSAHFHLAQEAFNRHYNLRLGLHRPQPNASAAGPAQHREAA